MRRWWLIFLAALLLATTAWATGASPAGAAGVLQVEPLPLKQGQPAIIRLELAVKAGAPQAEFMGKPVALWPGADGAFYGLLAPDLGVKGKQVLRVRLGGKQVAAAKLVVGKYDYGERRITVSKKFMSLTDAQLKRHWAEIKRQKAVFASFTPQRLWSGPFVRPVPGKMVGPFGRRSVINGEPRSPHGGIDLRAAMGAPIKACGGGVVALVDDTYFGGLVVLIDHGQGIISAYRHLSKALVKKSQAVKAGQVIGLAGKSGRVTGPHLHFDVHLNGSRVDPMAFIKASKTIAARF